MLNLILGKYGTGVSLTLIIAGGFIKLLEIIQQIPALPIQRLTELSAFGVLIGAFMLILKFILKDQKYFLTQLVEKMDTIRMEYVENSQRIQGILNDQTRIIQDLCHRMEIIEHKKE